MKLLREIIGRRPLRPVFRPVVKKLSLLPYRDRLELNWVDRPYYGHCIFEAAQLAARLHVPRISVIEFGCGGGNGLVNAEMHISEAKNIPRRRRAVWIRHGRGHARTPGLPRLSSLLQTG